MSSNARRHISGPIWRTFSCSCSPATCWACRSCRRTTVCACYPISWKRFHTGAAGSSASEIRLRVRSLTCMGFKDLFGTVKDVMYGMASHDMSRHALRTRASMEHLFILITMGDLLGVPILPPYYSLRLLPYVVPQISTWKRRMLRERDITDALG